MFSARWPEFDSWQGKEYISITLSTVALGSTQPIIQGTGALFQGVKQSESEADSSSASRDVWGDTALPLSLDGMIN
jgi:hypothetical protein